MNLYFLFNGAENIGPFDLDELKFRQITKDTPVWTEGMENWKNAGEIQELSDILSVVPPPITTNYDFPEDKNDGIKEKNIFWHITKIAMVVAVLGITLFSLKDCASAKKTSINSDSDKSEIYDNEKANPKNYLVAGGNFHKNFFGSKYVIEGYIKNNAKMIAYKNPVVEVTFYDKNKSVVQKENIIIYNSFSPNSRKNFDSKVKNYDNVESISWQIINAEIK